MARCGTGWRGKRNPDEVRGASDRSDRLWTVPGLEEWEEQANREEQPPRRQNNAWLLNPEGAREESSGKDQKSNLDAPED